jgi:UDP-hydrolysing UDP-N-acetyl-D-glucosamine 2-epimerase
MRKIAIITGTRADYGLFYWIIKHIHDDSKLELQLIVACMHLSPEFGLTIKEIERDGFPIAEKVEMLLSSDSAKSISISMGLGMIGFANIYARLNPNIILVLGDRFEALAAAAAAVPFTIPVAHIHGGEATEGAMDELFRHAITKMSHVHFASTEKYARRIMQMGEQPDNVFCFGAPGLDSISKLALLGKRQLESKLELPEGRNLGIVTYHAETLGTNLPGDHIRELLKAIDEISEIFWIITCPNADTGSRALIEMFKEYAIENQHRCKFVISLGQVNYLSLLKHAVVMVGNSSSGIIEAPSFQLPVVNVGDRQKGRLKAVNVLDVSICEKNRIVKAIKKAKSDRFRGSLKDLKNPYGDGNASEKIVEVLKNVQVSKKLQKRFYEI